MKTFILFSALLFLSASFCFGQEIHKVGKGNVKFYSQDKKLNITDAGNAFRSNSDAFSSYRKFEKQRIAYKVLGVTGTLAGLFTLSSIANGNGLLDGGIVTFYSIGALIGYFTLKSKAKKSAKQAVEIYNNDLYSKNKKKLPGL